MRQRQWGGGTRRRMWKSGNYGSSKLYLSAIYALAEYTHDLAVSASRSAEPPLCIRSSALGHRVNHWRECLQWPSAPAPSGRWQPHKGGQWHDFASRRAIDRPSSRSRAVAVAQAGRVRRFPAAIWPSTDDRRGLLFADRQSDE